MFEIALAVIASALLAWLGFWVIFYGFVGAVHVIAGPFVAVKRWLARRALDEEMAAKDREWADAMPHLTAADREQFRKKAERYFDGFTGPP